MGIFRLVLTVIIVFVIVTISGCMPDAKKCEKERICDADFDYLKLWYNEPAERWVEALPVGNGRLGAMVFGKIAKERIQLNEDTMWAGPPVPEPKEGMYEAIEQTRKLFFEGKYAEAERTAQASLPEHIDPRSHQTLGDLNLEFPISEDVSNYSRELDLDTAIATTSFVVNDTKYTREVFSSAVNDVIVVRLSADETGMIWVKSSLSRPVDFSCKTLSNDTIEMSGQVSQNGSHPGVKYYALCKAVTDGGEIKAIDNGLEVSGADTVTFYIAAGTDYNKALPSSCMADGYAKSLCEMKIQQAEFIGYGAVKKNHIQEHRRLFRRVGLDLGRTEVSDRPTDERLKAIAGGESDPAMASLYFQYGRYLLICSSRPGCMPANLQGIWNEYIAAPWNADYHININMQMNYWPTEVCNLSECHEPFLTILNGYWTTVRVMQKKFIIVAVQ